MSRRIASDDESALSVSPNYWVASAQVELLRQMMAYEPDKRISAVTALQHSFFNPPASPQSEKAASPAAAAAAPPAAAAAAAAATT